VPSRATSALPHALGGRAVAQDPAHGDQARTPLVPVLAALRVAPTVRTLHVHHTIRTRYRLAAIEGPAEVHLHGVTAEDVAAILREP
jgi:hypothetical protein